MSIRKAFFRGLFVWVALVSGTAVAVNPELVYFSKGDTPDSWQWVVKDPANYWMPLEGNQGVSAGGKVTLEPSDAPEFPGAVKATWDKAAVPEKKGNWGGLSIHGRSIDLSAYEHIGELVVALRVDAKPKKDVRVKLVCQGDKCAGEVLITSDLKKTKLKEWFLLPIPLDCFVKAEDAANFDLKTITSPFEIGTDSTKMILHIAEISIQKMAPGDEGCKPNTAPGG